MYSIKIKLAFTLLEILLVVVILGILVTMILPQFGKQYHNLQIQYAAEELVNHMRYAQTWAISHNENLIMETNDEMAQYQMKQTSLKDQQSLESKFSKDSQLSRRYSKLVTLPASIKMETPNEKVKFYPDGTIDKTYVDLCLEKKCYTISTREQRGAIILSDGSPND